jgi:hypothetical protein
MALSLWATQKVGNFLAQLIYGLCVCIVICICFAGNICPGIHLGNLDGKTNAESIFWAVESSRI